MTEAPRKRRVIAVIAAILLVGISLLGFWAYRSLNSNISTIDSGQGLGDVRPEKENESMNILAIGSDSRAGENAEIGGESPGLADTTLLVHLSADNSWATVVSIPRDSMVQMPECERADGTTQPAGMRQFNSAYSTGGPVCVQRTIESLTGLRVDHFAVVDFQGFQAMVDAVGGVTVYIEDPISDPNSKIYFKAGCQTLNGEQALDYVRVRHGAGDGSDTGRIARQQAFLASLMQKVTSAGVLTNPVALYDFLDAATGSVTTDTGLGSIPAMASLAARVREIGLNRIDFLTVPNEPYPPNRNRLQWVSDADDLWEQLRSDQPLSTPEPSDSASASPTEGTAGGATAEGEASASPSRSSQGKPATPSSSATSTFDTNSADEPVCPTE
ncbi:MAG: LCP family protein [Candidatus Nanopelagicales bacterium]